MSAALRWMIIRDDAPFTIGADLGVVHAPDKATAEQLGREQFGGRVIARSMLSRELDRREPLKPMPKKKHYAHGHGWPKGQKRPARQPKHTPTPESP